MVFTSALSNYSRVSLIILLAVGYLYGANSYAQDGSALRLTHTVAEAKSLIVSVAQADQVLEDVAKDRAAVEAQFVREERLCDVKFFVTRCVDAAKSQRREMLSQLRMMEIDAKRYKRRAAVDARDKALEESLQKKQGKLIEKEPVEQANKEAEKVELPEQGNQLNTEPAN